MHEMSYAYKTYSNVHIKNMQRLQDNSFCVWIEDNKHGNHVQLYVNALNTCAQFMHMFFHLPILYINGGKPYIEGKNHKEYLHHATLEAFKN